MAISTKLKLKYLGTTLFLMFNTLAVFVPNAQANGEIQVIGLILAEPCTLVNNDIVVDFGVLTNKDLFKYDRLEKFSVELDCEPGTNETTQVQFSSTNTSENNTILNLDPTSQASGVGIKIQDDKGNYITFNQPQSSFYLKSGINNLDFIAHVSRKSDTLTLSDIHLGAFTATSSLIIEYQ
ncbi:fimbrial protein [Acinetobacter sp.]|uniref:fimbrial protein n=1 Tax=Acinetobacter sp. TaxID=472 RepID=UPI0031D78E89